MKILVRKVALVFAPMVLMLFTLIMCSEPKEKINQIEETGNELAQANSLT